MRNLKVMTLTEKAEAFERVFKHAIQKINEGDSCEITEQILDYDAEDWKHVIDDDRVELEIYVDIRNAIASENKEELHGACAMLVDKIIEIGYSQLDDSEAIELSILKWEKNAWNPETRTWSLGHGSRTCPLCAIYRDRSEQRCHTSCPLGGVCVTDEMLAAIGAGNKEPIKEALRHARQDQLDVRSYDLRNIASLLVKESAMEEATVTFEISNNVIAGAKVEEK